MTISKDPDWFRSATVYQIYPKSFRDSNGDGIGDLRGIIGKLDYLKALGVDALWLCPIYASPNDDNGYDISDYQAIHPDYGSMADFEELLAGLHQRGMRLIMDMVLNHCSDEHAWFQSAKASPASPHRAWFHWQPANAAGGPPNRWGSFFSGSAWEFVPDARLPSGGEYYLHLFSKKQPDLNWENPELRQALYAMMRWWLDKGVDGFRLDVINFISKQPGYPEGDASPGSPWTSAFGKIVNGPRLHEFFQEIHREVFAPHGATTVGETPGMTVEIASRCTDPSRGELDMVFHFEMMDLDGGPQGKFDVHRATPAQLRGVCQRWQEGLAERGWNSLYWNNHDQPRPISRFGDPGEDRERSGKALAAFLYLQKGTAYVYQGEEIGMINLPWRDPAELRDIESINFIKESAGNPDWPFERVWRGILAKGRDNARTPFCWDDSAQAGFSAGTPWIRVHPAAERINAAESMARADSLWHYYRQLIAFRHAESLVARGGIHFVDTADPELLAYCRSPAGVGPKLWVAANLGSRSLQLGSDDILLREGAGRPEAMVAFLGNYPELPLGGGLWRPWEVRVWHSV